ncbi:RNA 2',3'-cyclic phosphodiesterase [uncultured archaeon]|nr:RNA 2',3'-cyclic phosphodiesterase [uncultured archaeon]
MRLFVAVDVPPWIKRVIYGVQQGLPKEGLALVGTENMHFTLKFLGEVNPKKVQHIDNALRKIEHKRFEAVVKGVGAFPNEDYVRVVWAGCRTKGMAELAAKVDKALPEFPPEPFVGHLTLARVKRKIMLRDFFEKYREWRFGDFKPEKFFLMGSELTAAGPEYTILAEYEMKE